MMTNWIIFNVGLLGIAYLLGSIPTGYLMTKMLSGMDIREVGSGSTGATNVLRNIGKIPAIIVLLIDVLKGVGAVLLIRWIYSLTMMADLAAYVGIEQLSLNTPWMELGAGLAALLGHSKSLWLGFSGGKSVATSLGVLLGLYWPVGLATFGIFCLVLAISRIVSLGSITGAISVSALMFLFNQPLPYLLFGIASGLFILIRHRSNIDRLLKGIEPRIGEKLNAENSESSAN